jgi:hypothetical protein
MRLPPFENCGVSAKPPEPVEISKRTPGNAAIAKPELPGLEAVPSTDIGQIACPSRRKRQLTRDESVNRSIEIELEPVLSVRRRQSAFRLQYSLASHPLADDECVEVALRGVRIDARWRLRACRLLVERRISVVTVRKDRGAVRARVGDRNDGGGIGDRKGSGGVGDRFGARVDRCRGVQRPGGPRLCTGLRLGTELHLPAAPEERGETDKRDGRDVFHDDLRQGEE